MTINQIKMLTTSCKNYKSLKQCVIEKKEAERRSGRKGELQTLIKSEWKTELFCYVVNYLPGLLVKLWNGAIKSFAQSWKSFQVTLEIKSGIGCQHGSTNLSWDHTRSDTWKRDDFICYVFISPFSFVSDLSRGWNFREKSFSCRER